MEYLKNFFAKKKFSAILAAVSLAGICEFSRIYVPDFVQNKFAYRLNRLIIILIGKLSQVGSILNYGSGHEAIVFRNQVDFLMKLFNKSIQQDLTDLRIINTKANNVPIRIYLPLNCSENSPIMFYYHGGAYVFLNIEAYDEFLIGLLKKLNLVIVSVDYRLAPENSFPLPINDNYEATSHVLTNLGEFGLEFVDKNRIILIGDSAGGNITTIISRQLLEKNSIRVKLQCLIYPAIQYFNFLFPSQIKFSNLEIPFSRAKFLLWHLGIQNFGKDLEDAILNNVHTLLIEDESIKSKFKSYLSTDLIPVKYKENKLYYDGYENLNESIIYPNKISKDYDYEKLFSSPILKEKLLNMFDINLSPGLASDDVLANQPTTLIIVCENDSRKDESLIYAERLKSNKVNCQVEFYEHGFHGVILNNDSIALDMKEKIIGFIESEFSQSDC